MKKFIIITIVFLLILSGCSAQNHTISSTTSLTTGSDLEISPIVIESQSAPADAITPSPSPSSTRYKKEFTYSSDGQDIVFYFDMPMDEALEALDISGIEYETRDDSSPFRSWSGYYVTTNKSFSLVFDLESKLHEIELFDSLRFNIPINVSDSYKDMIAALGNVGYEKHPTPYAIATHYCEYKMDGYYLRPIFGDEDLAPEDSNISEVILSKYSLEEYKNLFKPATLIFTNKNGDKANFYVGMSVDEVKAQLNALELSYSINNGVMSGSSYDDLPEDGSLPEGFDFHIYFNLNSCVHTIETYGPGVLTELGLQDGDLEEKMLELYGNDYVNVEFYNGYWHKYSYISGDNYLNISTSTEMDPLAPVTVLGISRYTQTNLKWDSYYGIE